MSAQIFLAVIFNVVMVGVLLFAALRGGRPERLGALINMAGFATTTAIRLIAARQGWAPGEVSILVIDAGVAAGFYWLGVTTTRFWPIWAAGFAVADLFMSIFGALLPRVPLFAYHTGLGIYAYLALGALALGTFRLPAKAEPYIRNGSRRLWVQHLKETT
ncbi:hypothetical protein [Sphingomonas sp. PAMC 26617]|uniref:hypothetical protein n=1 Tax=Sphingomonas sp. PAMC 26617 TaxID=1112216 RepID=UPI00028976AD|nr:hypothetical protein [Sphingomonas sp. PAMC 26617]